MKRIDRRLKINGTAALRVTAKRKYDDSLEYAFVRINGQELEKTIAAHLTAGQINDDDPLNDNIDLEGLVHLTISIIPVEPLDITVVAEKGDDN